MVTQIVDDKDVIMEEEKQPPLEPSRVKMNKDLSIHSDVKMHEEDTPLITFGGGIPPKVKVPESTFWSFTTNEKLQKTHKLQSEFMKSYGERLLKKYLLKEKEIGDPLRCHKIQRHMR